MFQRTSVGLDVHALSVVACAVDGQTGEITGVGNEVLVHELPPGGFTFIVDN